jgi:hypothetical protein
MCCLVVSRYVGFRHVRGPECQSCWKEVPIVTINTLDVPVARCGAALRHALSPWAVNLSGTGLQHVPAQNPAPAAPMANAGFVTPRPRAAMAQSLAVMAGLLIDNRKQYVHETRVNAGGDGASGPHPEREPA